MNAMSPKEYESQRRLEDYDRIQNMRPLDDIFMRCLFRDNLPLAETVLRTLTGIRDLKLVKEETQKDLKLLGGSRSLCLDVYGEDSRGRKYDLEVQKANKGAAPERARYHSAVMDVEHLSPQEDFVQLPETYVILVTERDFFGEGRALYPIERMDAVTGRLFGDKEHILYANGQYQGNDELGRLMHDFRCKEPEAMYLDEMSERAQYLKNDPEGVKEMSKMLEDMRNDAMQFGIQWGREQGLEQGIEQERLNGIRSLMKTTQWSAKQAMEALQVPEKEREKLLSAL